jgi:predicted Zn-dependent protease
VAELQDNVDTLQKRARETRRDHYRRRIQGLAFGDNPGDHMDFHAVRAGDTWESIAQRVCHGRVAATTLAIMNGYPVKKPPSADDQIKIIVGA